MYFVYRFSRRAHSVFKGVPLIFSATDLLMICVRLCSDKWALPGFHKGLLQNHLREQVRAAGAKGMQWSCSDKLFAAATSPLMDCLTGVWWLHGCVWTSLLVLDLRATWRCARQDKHEPEDKVYLLVVGEAFLVQLSGEACSDHMSIIVTWESPEIGISPLKSEADFSNVGKHRQAELVASQATLQARLARCLLAWLRLYFLVKILRSLSTYKSLITMLHVVSMQGALVMVCFCARLFVCVIATMHEGT